MVKPWLSTTLLTIPLALMAAGSLRDLITPLGYWTAWLLWAAVTAVLMRPRAGTWAKSWPPLAIMLSYGVLLLGMVIAGALNHDIASFYQALKIVVIAGLFVAMWWLVQRMQWQQFMTALYWIVGLMTASVVLTIAAGWAPAAGIRQGSVLAVYGVIWKVGALLLPMFLADFIVRPKARLINALMIALCIYLVMADGSRTAQLILLATLAGLTIFVVWCHGRRLLLKKLRWWVLVVLMVGSVLILSIGTHQFQKQRSAGPKTTNAPTLIDSIERGFKNTFRTRLGRGDPAREKLLRAGVQQSVSCLPIGCGFGKTATDIRGKGTPMPVHNAYLAALGDFGVLGFLGMLGFLLASGLPIFRVIKNPSDSTQGYYVVAAAGSALGYGMALMLNTFTTEMSEWGYLMVMLAFAWAPAKAG